ncbi:hypothetical protein E2320_014786 [Naja naja]|nr:hypothetical protein E2320_014786 [Naja naja]
MEKDNLSLRGTLRPEQMPLRDEVTVGLVDAKPISNSTSKRKRKSSLSGMNISENSLRSSGEQVEMVGCAEGPHDWSPERMQDKDEIACELLGATTIPILSPKKRKLILHIDLNNTILVSDAITKQDPSAALNYYLSTVTWGKLSHTGAVSFYSHTQHQIHRDVLGEEVPGPSQAPLEAARVAGSASPSALHQRRTGQTIPLACIEKGGVCHLRTFGTDLPRVLQAVSCALEGQHPGFPALGGISLPVDLRLGKIRCSKKKVVLNHGAEQLSSDNGCRKMYAYFSSREGISGFQDHFEWWAKNNYSSQGGKPIWVDPQDSRVQHICIDDNIRLTDSDTIVHPQVFLGQGNDSPRTIPTSELYDICLVQTDLLEAIADVNYFCHCIKRCEENYESYLSRVEACT